MCTNKKRGGEKGDINEMTKILTGSYCVIILEIEKK